MKNFLSSSLFLDCFVVLLLAMTMLFITTSAYAAPAGAPCTKKEHCDAPLDCVYTEGVQGYNQYCTAKGVAPGSIEAAIGKVKAPPAIGNLGFGAAGISNVLSNVIQIIYIVAAIVFVFMVVISAFQWIISGGDKEKLSAARGRLTNAILGIFLLAVAFVIIRVIGQITGFEFFSGQNNLLPGVDPGFQLSTEEENRRQDCNRLASQGFQWNQTNKQCEPTN